MRGFDVDLKSALNLSVDPHTLKPVERPRLIMGIDPGVHGGIAVYDPVLNKPRGIHEMPSITPDFKYKTKGMKTAKQRRAKVDGVGLANVIEGWAPEIGFCIIEDVHSMPSDGVVSAFSFGFSTGIIHGILASLKIPTFRVAPAVWKAQLNLSGKNKNASRYLAQKLHPEWALHFEYSKDDGKAEALLIAIFASRFVRKNAAT